VGVDYLQNREEWNRKATNVVFTGKIDEYFKYRFGELQYRTLKFESWVEDAENYQGNAVVNYADLDVPWTRVIEHKHFNPEIKSEKTVVTREIPTEWSSDKVPYYPINDEANSSVFEKYRDLSEREENVIFGGRLSEYRYYDMHQVIGSAMSKYRAIKRQEEKV
jgi:UDP-galactopyranose mutase